MSFTSPLYLPLWSLVAWLFFAARRWARAPLAVLAAASLLFYALWNPLYCLPLLATATVDWLVGRGLVVTAPRSRRRVLLAASLTCDLGTLACCKYFNLLAGTAGGLAAALGFELAVPLRVVFAVGISFYTFQSLSYVIDVYRGDREPCRSWLAYLAFVSFFPTLLSGPITRAETLLPQLERRPRPLDNRQWGQALFLLASGFVKKAAADLLARDLADRVFDLPGMFSSGEVLAGVYGYAVQIYLDFAGYSDIAIGSALLLGVRLKENFNAPYRSSDLAEFWRRWHISFSTWLRDYLFFALPGKDPRTAWPYLNLVITFALGGLWHGAAWTYLLWGVLHGLGLAMVRLITPRAPVRTRWWRVCSTVATFHFVAFAWLLFRCRSLGEVGAVLARLGAGDWRLGNVPLPAALVILATVALQWAPERWSNRLQEGFTALPAPAQAGCLVALFVGLRLLAGAAPAPFVYFAY